MNIGWWLVLLGLGLNSVLSGEDYEGYRVLREGCGSFSCRTWNIHIIFTIHITTASIDTYLWYHISIYHNNLIFTEVERIKLENKSSICIIELPTLDKSWCAVHDWLVSKFKRADWQLTAGPAVLDLCREPRLVNSSWRRSWPGTETTVSPGNWRTSKVEPEFSVNYPVSWR